MSTLQQDEQTTISVYDAMGAQWAAEHGDVNYWQEQFNRFRQLMPNGRVLDIGCGAARDAALLVEAGYEYVGIDPSSELLEQAKKAFPAATFLNATVYDLSQLGLKPFDGFWCSAVLLHIPHSRLPEALQQMSGVLKNDGIGFIAVKEGDGERTEEDGRTFFLWHKDEFADQLAQNGFDVVDYMYIPKSERTRWLCFFVKKGEPSA